LENIRTHYCTVLFWPKIPSPPDAMFFIEFSVGLQVFAGKTLWSGMKEIAVA